MLTRFLETSLQRPLNERVLNKALEITKAMQGQKKSGKSFHTSFAIQKNRIVCVGWNSYFKPHNQLRFGKYKKTRLPGEYIPCRHSECHLCEKLDEESWRDYEILNVRMNNLGEPRLALPCANCMEKVVIPMNPKRFYYTLNDGGYNQIDFEVQTCAIFYP